MQRAGVVKYYRAVSAVSVQFTVSCSRARIDSEARLKSENGKAQAPRKPYQSGLRRLKRSRLRDFRRLNRLCFVFNGSFVPIVRATDKSSEFNQ